jgi:hypothetical protein
MHLRGRGTLIRGVVRGCCRLGISRTLQADHVRERELRIVGKYWNGELKGHFIH